MTHHEQIRGFIAHLKKNKRLDMFECHAEPLQELLDENEKQAAAIKVLQSALEMLIGEIKAPSDLLKIGGVCGLSPVQQLGVIKARNALTETEEL